jgi:hypothetical protein
VLSLAPVGGRFVEQGLVSRLVGEKDSKGIGGHIVFSSVVSICCGTFAMCAPCRPAPPPFLAASARAAAP